MKARNWNTMGVRETRKEFREAMAQTQETIDRLYTRTTTFSNWFVCYGLFRVKGDKYKGSVYALDSIFLSRDGDLCAELTRVVQEPVSRIWSVTDEDVEAVTVDRLVFWKTLTYMIGGRR